MSGNQFGATAHTDDRFGYYAPVSTAPTGRGGSPGGPGGPRQASTVASRRSGAVWVAALVVIVLLIGAVAGSWWWRQRGHLVTPEQLGGMERNTSSPYSKVLDDALAQASLRAGKGNKVAGALYGHDPKQETLLLISRGPNVAAAQPAVLAAAGLKAYGPDLCAVTPKLVACMRMRADLSVVVLAVRAGTAVPPAVVAGWVDEAWVQQ